MKIIVYKDGSNKATEDCNSRMYENDPDWLVTIEVDKKAQERIAELESALKEIGETPWGWDGDCGVGSIVDRVFDN